MDFYTFMMVLTGMAAFVGMVAAGFAFSLYSTGESGRKNTARGFLVCLAALVLCWLWPIFLGAGIFLLLRLMIREAR